MRRFCGAVLVGVLGACGPLPEKAEVRVIKLRLVPPNSSQEALGGTRPVQLAAVQVEEGAFKAVFVGDAIDARTVQTLSVGVPTNASVNLILQAPRGGSGLGQLVGQVQFSDGNGGITSRIPAHKADLDLGEVAFVTGDPSTLADNRLPVSDASNPLARTDRDEDGTSDLLDTDDDADGTADSADEDADGDTLIDAQQLLSAMADNDGRDDGDGVPDALE